jgi:hypothetical protein
VTAKPIEERDAAMNTLSPTRQEIIMNKSSGELLDVELPSNRVRVTMKIWAITLGILFGGAILAKSALLVGDAPEVAVQHGVVVAGSAVDTSVPARTSNSESALVTAQRK